MLRFDVIVASAYLARCISAFKAAVEPYSD
nr:MAG TPA_asm: hypothetical protein [Caudoviricetes sp.]